MDWLHVGQQLVVLLGGIVALVQGSGILKGKRAQAALKAAGDELTHLSALADTAVNAAEQVGRVQELDGPEKLQYALDFFLDRLPEGSTFTIHQAEALIESVLKNKHWWGNDAKAAAAGVEEEWEDVMGVPAPGGDVACLKALADAAPAAEVQPGS
jgi:hypothetical protein